MSSDEAATKKNPELWSKAKSEAKAQLGGKWSARAAQLAVQKYKAQGGKYEGKKPSASKNSLVKWTKQEWQTRPGTPEKAERGGVTHRYLPKSKWQSLSKGEQIATDKKKVEGDKKGKQVVPNTPAARVKSAADHLEFQHDPSAPEPQPEGAMALSRLHHLIDMAGDLSHLLHSEDHLPPWVSDHITTAHENLSQVHSYIEPKAHELSPQPKIAGKLKSNPVGADENRSATGGLTAKGREHFARTEGAHLKPGVKEKNPSGENARRKGSFLTRFFTHPRGPMKDEKGRPTRLALSAQAWGEPVPNNDQDAHRLAAKGRKLLGKAKEAAMYDSYFQQALTKMASAKLSSDSAGYTEANDVGTVSGENAVEPPQPTGLDMSDHGYRWGQVDPQDPPATTGMRHPGSETLSSGSEAISADQNLAMLDRVFANMSEAQRVDRELIAQNFDAAHTPNGYVTRSKTLLEMVRGATGKR